MIKEWIPISDLCHVYEIEVYFFEALAEHELIELSIYEDRLSIQESSLHKLERIIRLSHELEVNLEGIDIILNLIQKIEGLKQELVSSKNKLRIYEDL